jgi:hypothetical protein
MIQANVKIFLGKAITLDELVVSMHMPEMKNSQYM